jgi:hypothetical protein
MPNSARDSKAIGLEIASTNQSKRENLRYHPRDTSDEMEGVLGERQLEGIKDRVKGLLERQANYIRRL